MSTARRLHYTYAEYLDVERMSSVRHEYFDGEIYAMAGGTPEHAILASKLAMLLGAQLFSNCRVASSDLKINVIATGLSTYPDLTIVCGPLERDARDALAVTNPFLIAEVTSPSTEDYDRGEKLSHYRQIPSLEGVLIVSHCTKRVTVMRRQEGAWNVSELRSGERFDFEHHALQFLIDDLYSVLDGL